MQLDANASARRKLRDGGRERAAVAACGADVAHGRGRKALRRLVLNGDGAALRFAPEGEPHDEVVEKQQRRRDQQAAVMRQRSQRRGREECLRPTERYAQALRRAEVRHAKLEAVSNSIALDLRSAEAPGGRATAARVSFGGDHFRRQFRRQVHAQDGLVHRKAPIMPDRVPVELIVIGQELQHAIGFVADGEAMIAGRERLIRRDAQLFVS